MATKQPRVAQRIGRPHKAETEAIDGRLLDAAEFLFLEHGFDGASVAAVAALAGSSKQTIYHRYPSKVHLFEAVIGRAIERFVAEVDRKVVGRSIEARIGNLAMLFVERTLDPQSLRLMRAIVAEVGRFGEIARTLDRDAHRRIEQFIIETGELDTLIGEAEGPVARAAAARRLMDLTVNPLVLRALLGADVGLLRREAEQTMKANVALFLKSFER